MQYTTGTCLGTKRIRSKPKLNIPGNVPEGEDDRILNKLCRS